MKTRPLLALTAAAIVLASCGGTSTSPATDPATAPTTTPATTLTADPDTETSATDSDEQPTSQEPAGPSPDSEPAETEVDRIIGPFPESQFPDVIVEDLAGGQVNTKFLATLDKPVLLWFWAPH
ncbi:MAG: hypothetical protein HKO76_10565 [Acidimicrobiia bacterium]|nr:hypothetical protein [Acidimicrobiia bacterium]